MEGGLLTAVLGIGGAVGVWWLFKVFVADARRPSEQALDVLGKRADMLASALDEIAEWSKRNPEETPETALKQVTRYAKWKAASYRDGTLLRHSDD